MSNSQQILKITYGVLPMVAGLDKFTNRLTDWKHYLFRSVINMLPVSASTFMMIVGIIEITAGLLVLVRPLIGSYVVMAWLIAIAITLIAGGHYYDVAVRDPVMAVGAYVLTRLSRKTSLPGLNL